MSITINNYLTQQHQFEEDAENMKKVKKELQLDYIDTNSRITSRLRYKDLIPTNNLKSIFEDIRNYLAGNAKGITRDETLAQELINILFCKIYDEKKKKPSDLMDFYALYGEDAKKSKNRLVEYFEKKVKHEYKNILLDSQIHLDSSSIYYVLYNLQRFNISGAERDVIGDAFESFFGPALRGPEGQFFTPKNVMQMIVNILDPKPNEKIIDPACGSGGFLIMSLYYIYKKLLLSKGSSKDVSNKFKDVASNNIVGIDKDNFLAEVAKTYMTLIGDGKAGIFCEDSLESQEKWCSTTKDRVSLESFDILMTNPPFGAKIPIEGAEKLKQYNLGHRWQKDKKSEKWIMQNTLLDKQPPQIIFIERCIQLLKKGGRMGIVLPEGIFGNPSDRYIWEYLFANVKILAVVSLNQETFQPSTHTKTSVLILEKNKTDKNYDIFMAIAEKVGHDKNGKVVYKINKDGSFILDKNGNKIIDDDLPLVSESYLKPKDGYTHLGFWVNSKDVKKEYILIPEYFNPEIKTQLNKLKRTDKYDFYTIKDLINKDYIQISRGNEIGSQFYGTGEIPFVRTSDIVNWEIKIDPIKCVSEEIYETYKRKQDVQPNDILFVSDGTFLIGRSAIVTNLDKKIIIQSHLKKIRVKENPLFDCYLLFYLLNSDIVQNQIRAKTFIQATISSLGRRLEEIMLPIPKSAKRKTSLSREIKEIFNAKERIRRKCLELTRL